MLRIFIPLIMSLIADSESPKMDYTSPSVYETNTLRQIDLSCDSILYRILEDASDKVKYGDRPAYYSVSLHNYKNGTIVRIVRSYSDFFDHQAFKLGYIEVNGKLMVFFRGNSDYKITYSKEPHDLNINTGNFDYTKDVSDIKYYYILDDIFARFSPEVGWIWSDGKPDE